MRDVSIEFLEEKQSQGRWLLQVYSLKVSTLWHESLAGEDTPDCRLVNPTVGE